MSESPSQSDRTLIPLLAAGVQVALVVAVWGFTSLLLDRDVIPDLALGPLAGPIAVAASGAADLVPTAHEDYLDVIAVVEENLQRRRRRDS